MTEASEEGLSEVFVGGQFVGWRCPRGCEGVMRVNERRSGERGGVVLRCPECGELASPGDATWGLHLEGTALDE